MAQRRSAPLRLKPFYRLFGLALFRFPRVPTLRAHLLLAQLVSLSLLTLSTSLLARSLAVSRSLCLALSLSGSSFINVFVFHFVIVVGRFFSHMTSFCFLSCYVSFVFSSAQTSCLQPLAPPPPPSLLTHLVYISDSQNVVVPAPSLTHSLSLHVDLPLSFLIIIFIFLFICSFEDLWSRKLCKMSSSLNEHSKHLHTQLPLVYVCVLSECVWG